MEDRPHVHDDVDFDLHALMADAVKQIIKYEAQERLDHAIGSLPKCPRYLLRERVHKPKLHADGIRIGGDDQAWLYRESMRDVWKSTPNALAWLRRSAPRCGLLSRFTAGT